MTRNALFPTLVGLLLAGSGCGGSQAQVKEPPALTVAWPVSGLARVGGYRTQQMGTPKVEDDGTGPAVCFSGADDGLDVQINPLDLQTGFTIEVLFKPEAGGNPRQQFLHLQDGQGGNILLELGVGVNGEFRLHSFAKVGDEGKDLEDSSSVHPAGTWYWASLTYAEEWLRLYLNGVEQAAAPVALKPMASGEMGIGYKLSEENYFRGCVRELRFANQALPVERLARAE